MKNVSVLIVDDDDSFRETLGDIFRAHSFVVDLVDSGYKAIDYVKRSPYDVILMDVNMPGIDGVQAFNEIKKIRPDTIIIMMTGGNLEVLKALLEKGVSAIMPKPLDVEKVIGMIGNLEKKDLVMVVDDSENDRMILAEILSSKGYRVITAREGGDAIEQVQKNKDVDVVLLDIRLPDMDGVSVMDRIKQYKPTLGIIAMTGYSLDGMIDSIVNKGAYTCLIKPFNVELLLHEIHSLVRKVKTKQQLPATGKESVKILIVEDDEGIRVTSAAILTEEGYSVTAAASLPEGLEAVAKETFSIVISDLLLGENSSGLSLVEPVKGKDAATVFLLMTGQGTMETALEAIKKGVDEYILKPIQPAELTRKVATYAEKQRIKKEKEALMQQLQESNMKLLEMVKVDELTGVFNRRFMFEQLHHEMERAKRQKDSLALMMVDVDGFKKHNDTYGHLEGDKILKDVAGLLKASVRQYVDQVFRYGGDEFAILVPNIGPCDALSLAERIVVKVKNALAGKNVGISIGVACFDKGNQLLSLNELIHTADKRLYEAKSAGKGRAVL